MCINYLSQYIKYTDSVIIDKLIKFYYTWDMYSLSVLYLKYLGYMFFDGFTDNELIINISQLFLINIHPNPLMRVNPVNSKKQINNLLYMDNSCKSYKKIIDNFNNDKISSN